MSRTIATSELSVVMNCAAERLGSGSAIALLSQFDVSSGDV